MDQQQVSCSLVMSVGGIHKCLGVFDLHLWRQQHFPEWHEYAKTLKYLWRRGREWLNWQGSQHNRKPETKAGCCCVKVLAIWRAGEKPLLLMRKGDAATQDCCKQVGGWSAGSLQTNHQQCGKWKANTEIVTRRLKWKGAILKESGETAVHGICETCHSVAFYFMKKLIFWYEQEVHFTKYDTLQSYLKVYATCL